jgi:hypothetical protein
MLTTMSRLQGADPQLAIPQVAKHNIHVIGSREGEVGHEVVQKRDAVAVSVVQLDVFAKGLLSIHDLRKQIIHGNLEACLVGELKVAEDIRLRFGRTPS